MQFIVISPIFRVRIRFRFFLILSSRTCLTVSTEINLRRLCAHTIKCTNTVPEFLISGPKPFYRGRGRAMRLNRDEESSVSSSSGSASSYSTYMPSTAPSESSLETLAPRPQQQSSSSGSSGGRGRSTGRVYRRTGGRGSGGSRDRNLEEGRNPISGSSRTFSSSGKKSGKSTSSSGQEGKADEEMKADRAEKRLKMEALSIPERQLMPRPEYGTVGKRADVTTNSFEVIQKSGSL